MTEKKMVEPRQISARVLESVEERAAGEAKRFGALNGGRQEPYLKWAGGFICIVLAAVALAVIANSTGWLSFGNRPTALAAEQATAFLPARANRASCAEIGSSDLRLPAEGLWFQSNCVAVPELPFTALTTSCNRTRLGAAEFTEVSPRLFIFRQTLSSTAYLWYSSSESCFDLVSARVVTAVCADQAVTFQWNGRSACSSHGGVLAMVNGR
jgi:hypothetical protein